MNKPLFLEPKLLVREEPHINWWADEEDERNYEAEIWHALVRLSEYYDLDLQPKKNQRPHRQKSFFRKTQ